MDNTPCTFTLSYPRFKLKSFTLHEKLVVKPFHGHISQCNHSSTVFHSGLSTKLPSDSLIFLVGRIALALPTFTIKLSVPNNTSKTLAILGFCLFSQNCADKII